MKNTMLAVLALLCPLVLAAPAHADVNAPIDADAPLVLGAAPEVLACSSDLVVVQVAPALDVQLAVLELPAAAPELQQNGVRLPGNQVELALEPLMAAGLDEKTIDLIAKVSTPFILGVFGWVYTKIVKDKQRRAQVKEIANESFHAAEQLGVLDGIRNDAKLGRYLGFIEDALAAEGAKALTERERGRAREQAKRVALITKQPKTPPPLPKV